MYFLLTFQVRTRGGAGKTQLQWLPPAPRCSPKSTLKELLILISKHKTEQEQETKNKQKTWWSKQVPHLIDELETLALALCALQADSRPHRQT